ncbi:hypothetical protein [Comamonas thiooxydans]|uniref:hypothetical protein n=1 Tax=Comamonas thiooxydans TaxID=363952 RepID=UPI000B40C63A|nr:hypothetical protein [Comamonas thiooxydans]
MRHTQNFAFGALVATGLLLNSVAFAQDRTIATPAAATYGAAPTVAAAAPDVDIQSLPLDEAKLLLGGSSGSAWRVLDVQAPACTSKKAKDCKPLKKQCDLAQKFAKKYRKHATCSELYTQTSVLLIPASVAKSAN